jgi:hypothetical protein
LALPVKEQFLELAEQPFLNFLIETQGIPVAKVGDLFADVAGTTWAGARLSQREDRWVVNEPSWPDHGRPLAALHWSGTMPSPLMPHRRLFVDYRSGPGGQFARLTVNVRLAALAAAALRHKARSALDVLRGRQLGAWR